MVIKDLICDCLGVVNSTSKFIIGGLKSFMEDVGKNNISFKQTNYIDV